jgi:hypothetical protein
MKLNAFALMAMIALPFSAFAGSNWQLAMTEATEQYAIDYKTDFNKTSSEPVSFVIKRAGEELVTTVYFTEAESLRSYTYGCHPHGDHADCEPEGKGEHGAYARLTSKYNSEEMTKAAGDALALFGRRVAPESSVQSLKIWESEELIRLTINYEKDGLKQDFMDCHYHGGRTMDCHRKGTAGPGEPDKK